MNKHENYMKNATPDVRWQSKVCSKSKISPKIQSLFQLIEKYIDRHSRLGGNAKDHLIDSGNEVKTPGIMASAFSWFSTELKLNLNDDNSKIAKLLIDGCSMGIKTLGERANTLNRADKSADALARKIIKTEEEMIRELESFL